MDLQNTACKCIQVSDSPLSNSALQKTSFVKRHILDVTKAGFFFEPVSLFKETEKVWHCLLQGLSWISEGRFKFHLLKEILRSPISETFGIEPDCPLFATER